VCILKYIKYISLLFIILVFSCDKTDPSDNNPHNITILYTNDEHGWIEKSEVADGAAKLMGLWKEVEGYDSNDESFLILSGGDNWTGPAISTWFEGESTVEVMNAMEYDASAIGNHEFDFKVDGLYDRIDEANFPYLSANIREKISGEIPDFATPYILIDIDGILIGIIGLTTTSTPVTTFPDNVKDYNYIDYGTALEEIVPQVKLDGAEIIIVAAHICDSEMTNLVDTLIRLGISAIGGGHCHEDQVARLVRTSNGEVAIIKGLSYLRSYAKIEIDYDKIDNEIISMTPSIHFNEGGSPEISVSDVVSHWRTETNNELSEVIGYTDVEIGRQSNEMHNMVVDSWLFNYPSADIAMTNAGGIRQSIPAGEITKEVIIGVLPFQNFIIELQLTGSEIVECLKIPYIDLIVGGMTTIGGYFLADGTPIVENATYSVLTTDYLYARPDQPFSQYDSNPYYTSMNYHQPTIDWISSLNTSSANPLSNHLDNIARQ